MSSFPAVLKGLGRKIKDLRKQRGWSQERLAGVAGISRTHMGAIEIGTKEPSVWTLFRIARALEAPVGELFLVPAAMPASQREVVVRISAKLLAKVRTTAQLQKVEGLIDVFLQER